MVRHFRVKDANHRGGEIPYEQISRICCSWNDRLSDRDHFSLYDDTTKSEPA